MNGIGMVHLENVPELPVCESEAGSCAETVSEEDLLEDEAEKLWCVFELEEMTGCDCESLSVGDGN